MTSSYQPLSGVHPFVSLCSRNKKKLSVANVQVAVEMKEEKILFGVLTPNTYQEGELCVKLAFIIPL